jgi:uncharacterized protein YecT (DUF1311 family)
MKIIIAILLSLSTSTALAIENPGVSSQLVKLEEIYQNCLESAESNVDMKICTGQAAESAGQLLAVQLRKIVENLSVSSGDQLLDRYNAETLRRLRVSQKAWLRFRDAQCSLDASEMLFGTGEGLIYSGCLYRMTVERIQALQKLFDPDEMTLE